MEKEEKTLTEEEKEAAKVEDAASKELIKRMEGKDKPEKAKILRDYMEKDLGIKFEEPTVTLSDEQVRMIVSGATEDAKKVQEAASSEIEKKYNISPSEAKARTEEYLNSARVKDAHKLEDWKECAKVIRAVVHTAKGTAAPGELHEAYEIEAEYLKATGREVRAMSLGTDTSGGYLGGELFETMLYENISRYSMARKYCTLIQMEKEILRIPKLTATLTAEQTSEAAAISESEPTYAQFTLTTKKLAVLTTPFSIELLEVAEPALVPALIEFATREIKKKEDALVFGLGAPGLLSHNTNNVDMGGSDSSGSDSITDLTFDDMLNLIYELDPHYIPDEDIQGSGIFSSGAARFWVPQSAVLALAKSKGNDNYHWASVQELKHDKRVHGYDIKRVPGMATAPTADVHTGVFGDLGYMVCGVRPGFRIELLSQGTVDSINLNETASYAIRVIEFFDNDSIDDNAFSILETSST